MPIVILIFLTGLLIGYFLHTFILSWRLESVKSLSEKMLQRAEKESVLLQQKSTEQIALSERQFQEKIAKQNEEFKLKELDFKHKTKELNQKLAEVEKKEKELLKKIAENKTLQEKLQTDIHTQNAEFSRIANLTPNEARSEIYAKANFELEDELQKLFAKKLQAYEKHFEDDTKRLIIGSINRLSSATQDASITYFSLPNDDIKAKIIGRDGKNIKAFEQITGVSLVIDETPQTVLLSSFDPIRRHLAKLTLDDLLQDSKINPMTIEKLFKKHEAHLPQSLLQLGKDAQTKALVSDLHPELLKVLGKLHFRVNFGQNVLAHSIEVSHLMGLLAAELNLNERKARRIGLLHDIGKALPAELGKSHAISGHNFVLQYGENEEIANGIGCHHDEMTPLTSEAALCKAADAISAKRPGVRSQNSEKHTQKLTLLEELAMQFEGVEKAYAIQAGREVRVFVRPDMVDDVQATHLARKIAQKIEATSDTFDKVQVTIVREKKITDFALH